MANNASVIHGLPQTSPADTHNRELVSHVHPPDWENPRPDGRYNMVVIGGGTAGLVTAAGAAGLGAKVALVERALLGGDCLNVGCVPSKALIRSARSAAEARRANEFGVQIAGEIAVDFPKVMERMRRLRAHIAPHDSASRFRDMGIDVFIGEARFTGPNTIDVDGTSLEFSRACIATGGRAAVPPIDGIDDAGCLTNETVFSLTRLPRRLGIVGAGPIGCELAQVFARFGSEVHLIEASDQILSREDSDAADVIQRALTNDGVVIHTSAQVTRFTTSSEDRTLHFGASDAPLTVDEVLIAVGRAPNVEKLDLDAAGVEFDTRRGIAVDDSLRTTNRRIYAAGDVCSKYKFTHTADALARIVIRNALFPGRSKASDLTIPWCTYTDPEVAHVGMYEKDAREQGIECATLRIPFEDVDRAVLEGATEGFLKVHLKKGSDRILGATLVGPNAGDMISELTLAIGTGAGLSKLSETIHPYPTLAEIIRRAGDQYNRGRLTPVVRGLFEKWLRWRR